MKTLEISYLKECLIYEPLTGEFWWKHRPEGHFKHYAYGYLAWNARNAGKVAGEHDKHGYWMISIGKTWYFAHRLAWAISYGVWPNFEVDHINHVRDDNRLANLRDVQPFENGKNRPWYSRNTSGVMGVSWSKSNRKWQVQIGGGKPHLGYFDSFDEAVAVRKQAEIDRGYHRNHGTR